MTRMRVSAVAGSDAALHFRAVVRSRLRAPTHLHAVEEVLTVLEGQAEAWLGDERSPMTAGQSLIVPAGIKHGFRNTGDTTLHVQATLAAPIFEAAFDDAREMSRRWLPQTKHEPNTHGPNARQDGTASSQGQRRGRQLPAKAMRARKSGKPGNGLSAEAKLAELKRRLLRDCPTSAPPVRCSAGTRPPTCRRAAPPRAPARARR